MRDLIRSLTATLSSGGEAIHCQVVETKGSTPQKAGARMLVDALGGQVGTLGGGCVEAEVKQKAIRRIGRDGADLHAFVLDHDYAWADGLICGGKMVILAEALKGREATDYFRAFGAQLETGRGLTEAVVLDPERADLPVGTRLLFGERGEPLAGYPSAPEPARLGAVAPLVDRPRPGVRAGVAFLPILPRIRLVIVGAGHVGQAVAELAAKCDFDVWVVDDRRQYANRERFPAAETLIVGPMEDVLPALDISETTYALIVTRGHGHDQEALFHLASTAAPYVGLIGSRRKIRMIFEALREQGVAEASLSRVSAPVGLDIGSESVAEIAVSIVGELIARRNLGARATREPGAAGDGVALG